MTKCNRSFLAMLPIISRHADFAFRRLSRQVREDLVQEVVANCFVAYVRLIERDKQDAAYPSALARYAIRSVKRGRRVGTSQNVDDVTSRYCQLATGATVERLAECDDRHSTRPEDTAMRLDFAAWLDSLSRGRRQIAKSLAAGETTTEVARQLGVCPSRVSQIRNELRESWEDFCDDNPNTKGTPQP